MAAFSYQQHHHPFLLDSSEFIEEGSFFSQFYYPPKFPTHDDHQEMIVGDDNSNTLLDAAAVFETSFGDNHDHHSDDNCNEPSNNNSLVTKNQSATVSSTEQQLTRSTVTTTTTTTRMDKRRKDRTNASSSSFNSAQSKDPREVKSKKPKKGNVNDAKKEGKENDPKADNEKKVAKEPPKDYIHVRARRGQATDSHSLAERVRREKISERMKILQKLVPGCDKLTGKAYMLDEIINYVQFLQNQVEFLSMKLASVNPMFYDFGMDLDNTFMVRPDDRQSLNSIAAAASASVPSLQCSPTTQLTAFADTSTTFVPADHHNNYPVLDTALLLQQGQRLNALMSQGNGNSLLWDVEDQKQKFLNPSGFTTNLCSFN